MSVEILIKIKTQNYQYSLKTIKISWNYDHLQKLDICEQSFSVKDHSCLSLNMLWMVKAVDLILTFSVNIVKCEYSKIRLDIQLIQLQILNCIFQSVLS